MYHVTGTVLLYIRPGVSEQDDVSQLFPHGGALKCSSSHGTPGRVLLQSCLFLCIDYVHVILLAFYLIFVLYIKVYRLI